MTQPKKGEIDHLTMLETGKEIIHGGAHGGSGEGL